MRMCRWPCSWCWGKISDGYSKTTHHLGEGASGDAGRAGRSPRLAEQRRRRLLLLLGATATAASPLTAERETKLPQINSPLWWQIHLMFPPPPFDSQPSDFRKKKSKVRDFVFLKTNTKPLAACFPPLTPTLRFVFFFFAVMDQTRPQMCIAHFRLSSPDWRKKSLIFN